MPLIPQKGLPPGPFGIFIPPIRAPRFFIFPELSYSKVPIGILIDRHSRILSANIEEQVWFRLLFAFASIPQGPIIRLIEFCGFRSFHKPPLNNRAGFFKECQEFILYWQVDHVPEKLRFGWQTKLFNNLLDWAFFYVFHLTTS